ncbi:MAG: hypothetical protein ACLRFE_01090 [Clostridia bacterium]
MKNKSNIKDNGRLIAKMISTILITAGVASGATGICLARKGVSEMPENYVDNGKYIAGVIASTLGAVSTSLGFATYPYKSSNSNDEQTQKDEKQNTL